MAFTAPFSPTHMMRWRPILMLKTMQIHHGKHHQAYVDNPNKAIDRTPNAGATLEDLLWPAGSISPAVRNNGGGHFEPYIFWESMALAGKGNPGSACQSHRYSFRLFESFKEKLLRLAWHVLAADGHGCSNWTDGFMAISSTRLTRITR